MKSKVFKFAAVASCMIGACALIGGCGSGDGSGQFSKEEVYGIGAVSCVEILGNSLNAKSAKTFADLTRTAAAQTSDDIKAQAENFNKYFEALNSFLDDSALSVVTENNSDESYSDYATKLTVKGRDIAGNATEYVMYYNETFLGQSEHGNETESRYSLDGVMLTDGIEYRITGGKEIETEHGEREEELKIRAYIGEATGDFVEMKQEISVDGNERETEYVYRVYSNNRLVEQTSVEFETETKNGKSQTEFELKFINGEGKGKYKVEREVKNGITEISVKYDLDGKKGRFTIKEIVKDGQPYYEYTFDDNTSCSFEKHGGNHYGHENDNHDNHH